jgi:hypothetical protein
MRSWSILFAGPAMLGVVYLLALMAPAGMVAASPAFRFSLPVLPVYAICVYSAWRLGELAGAGRPRVVTLTFWSFVYVFLGICPFLQIGTGSFPLDVRHDDQVLVHAALIVLTGLASFDLGQSMLFRSFGRLAVPSILQRRLRNPAIAVMAVASVACAAVLMHRLGGMAVLFLPRAERTEYFADRFSGPELMLLTHFARVPIYVAFMAALVVWARARRGAFPLLAKPLTFLLFVGTLLMNNPVSTPRFTVGTIVLSVFFVLPWKRGYAALAALALAFGLVFVFPLTDVFRNTLDTGLSEKAKQRTPLKQLTDKGDFDAFQQTANGIVLAQKEGLQLGRQAAGAILFWVPRSAWHEKPQATGEFIGERLGYGFTNLSAPLWVELYLDGGIALVVAGFLAYGAFVRTVDDWHQRSHAEGLPVTLALLVPIFAGYQFFLLRGSLMPAVAYFTPILVCAVLCAFPLLPSMRVVKPVSHA